MRTPPCIYSVTRLDTAITPSIYADVAVCDMAFIILKIAGIYGIYYYYRDCVFKRWINDLLHKANAEIDHERELRFGVPVAGEKSSMRRTGITTGGAEGHLRAGRNGGDVRGIGCFQAYEDRRYDRECPVDL